MSNEYSFRNLKCACNDKLNTWFAQNYYVGDALIRDGACDKSNMHRD